MLSEIKKNIWIVALVLIVSLMGLIFFVIMDDSLGSALGIVSLTILVVSCINGLKALLDKKKEFNHWENELDKEDTIYHLTKNDE